MENRKIEIIKINSQQELTEAVSKIESCGYNRVSRHLKSFAQLKKHYHGNSKLIITLFHNSILGQNEWQFSTVPIEKRNHAFFPVMQKLQFVDVTKEYLKN